MMKDVCVILFFFVFFWKLHTQIRFFFNRPPFRHSRSRFDTIPKEAADILNRNLFLQKPFMALVPLRVHTLCGATAATSVQRATRRVLLLLLLSSTISSNTRPPARRNNLQMELRTLTSVASVVPVHFPSRSAARDVVFVPLCTRSVSSQFAVIYLFLDSSIHSLLHCIKLLKKHHFFCFYIADFGYNISLPFCCICSLGFSFPEIWNQRLLVCVMKKKRRTEQIKTEYNVVWWFI